MVLKEKIFCLLNFSETISISKALYKGKWLLLGYSQKEIQQIESNLRE